MKKEFATKHGIVTATLPDNSTIEDEALKQSADYLDQLAWSWGSDHTTFEGKDTEGNVTSHLEWSKG